MGKIDCSSCGKAVDEDMLFCPYCFNEFSKKQEEPPAEVKKAKPDSDEDYQEEPRAKEKKRRF